MNDLGEYAHIFDGIPTWRGMAPPGYTVDFLGTLTATDFLQSIAEQSGPQSFYSVDLDGCPGWAFAAGWGATAWVVFAGSVVVFPDPDPDPDPGGRMDADDGATGARSPGSPE